MLNELNGANVLVIGGAGFIGSHVVAELLKTKVNKITVYDNFARGRKEYLEPYLSDPRCELFENGGDIREVDLLDAAMKDTDYVIHLAAMASTFKVILEQLSQ